MSTQTTMDTRQARLEAALQKQTTGYSPTDVEALRSRVVKARSAVEDLEQRIAAASTAHRAALDKQQAIEAELDGSRLRARELEDHVRAAQEAARDRALSAEQTEAARARCREACHARDEAWDAAHQLERDFADANHRRAGIQKELSSLRGDVGGRTCSPLAAAKDALHSAENDLRQAERAVEAFRRELDEDPGPSAA